MSEYKANILAISFREGDGLAQGPGPLLQPKSVHFGLFVVAILADVAETVIKTPGLLRQRPNQAFSCRHDLRLAAKHGVFKRERGVNPLPAGVLQGTHNLRKDKSVQRIEMHQQRVANIAAENIECELTIERSAIEQMSDEVVAIRGDGSVGLLAETIDETLAYVPVRSINGDMADAVAALLEQRAKSITLVRGVAFLHERVTEEEGAVVA